MPRKLDANQEALLIALACSEPPEGLCRWTLNLIADYVVQMEHVLDLYACPANDAQPVVNFDEAMKQLVCDITPASAAKPG